MEGCLAFQSTHDDSEFSAQPRQKIAAWHMESIWITGERFFGNQFSTFDSPRDHPQEFHSCATQRERRPVPQATRIDDTFFTRNDKQNTGTIPMPTLAGRPSTMSSSILVEFLQNSIVGQQRPQTSELQFDKFSCPQSFLLWKIRFKNQVTTCSDFPPEAVLWIKKWRWLIH